MSISNERDQQVRFITAASLFDGHDAAINIMRRVMQSEGAEVIHLGHDRSVDELSKLLSKMSMESLCPAIKADIWSFSRTWSTN